MSEQQTEHPGEDILPDDHPVHWDYAYIVDGELQLSPLGGGATVRDLKRTLKAKEVRRCNLVSRKLL